MRRPRSYALIPTHLGTRHQMFASNDQSKELLDELAWGAGSWLSSAVQSPTSAQPESGSDRTFGPVSTAVGRRADLPWAGPDRPFETQSCRDGQQDPEAS
jgi:hypothetical protein